MNKIQKACIGLLMLATAIVAFQATALAMTETQTVQGCHLWVGVTPSCGGKPIGPIPAGAILTLEVTTYDDGSPGDVGEVARIKIEGGQSDLTLDVPADGSEIVKTMTFELTQPVTFLVIDHAQVPGTEGPRSFNVGAIKVSWQLPQTPTTTTTVVEVPSTTVPVTEAPTTTVPVIETPPTTMPVTTVPVETTPPPTVSDNPPVAVVTVPDDQLAHTGVGMTLIGLGSAMLAIGRFLLSFSRRKALLGSLS